MAKGRLEFKVNIPSSGIKKPKSAVKSAYNSYISDLNNDIIPELMEVKNVKELNKLISKINKKNKIIIKDKIKDEIGGVVEFSDIASADSFGMSVNARVNVSANRVLKQNKAKIKSLWTNINKTNKIAKKGIKTSNEAQKEIDKYIKNYINNVSKSLGGESSRIIEYETQAFRQREADEKMAGKEVKWKLGANENHCEICKGYAENIYKSPSEAPTRPVHNHCECYLELTGN